jgi:hypothetical protein
MHLLYSIIAGGCSLSKALGGVYLSYGALKRMLERVPARIGASGGAASVKLKPIFVPVVYEQ